MMIISPPVFCLSIMDYSYCISLIFIVTEDIRSYCQVSNFLMLAISGLMTPFSVMMPVIYFAGVTSNEGFSAVEPGALTLIFSIFPEDAGPSW